MKRALHFLFGIALLMALMPSQVAAQVGIPEGITDCDSPVSNTDDRHYFGPQSGDPKEICFKVEGDFWYYWRDKGGLPIFGYPISRAFVETFEDGSKRWVQYFERARFELHEEHKGTEFYVLLGHFGREILTQHPELSGAAQPVYQKHDEHTRYFPETRHNVSGDFLFYWERFGGLMTFGYPLTEATHQTFPDGTVRWVQYFERARFELHPELQETDYYVLLGHFGREILSQHMNGGSEQVNCSPQTSNFDPKPGIWWELPGDNVHRVVQFWTNWANQDQSLVKILMHPGENQALGGGGQVAVFPPECGEVAQAYINDSPGSATSLDALRARGLVR